MSWVNTHLEFVQSVTKKKGEARLKRVMMLYPF